MLRINAVKVSVETELGEYGFSCAFSSGLNIIRGDNSAGKSTLLNSIMYGIGLEEILGGRNEGTLPYCLKSYFFEKGDESRKIEIQSSSVLVEIFNGRDAITLRRAIRSNTKSTKLIEVIHGPFLTKSESSLKVTPTFIHDPGSAQSNLAGYFKYLENYLGLSLPNVLSQSGEVKLYIQTIFASIFIEQKKGWTDYIANIPYFRIRNAQQKIFEFLLGFTTFENELARAELQSMLIETDKNWKTERANIKIVEGRNFVTIGGIHQDVDPEFNPRLVTISKPTENGSINIQEYISSLSKELAEALKSLEIPDSKPSEKNREAANQFEKHLSELSLLTAKYAMVEKALSTSQQALKEYEGSKTELLEDIEKNRVAKKMKTLGADFGLNSTAGKCPTCLQAIQDDLAFQYHEHVTMSIEENLDYLSSQITMVDACIKSQHADLEKKRLILEDTKVEIQKRRELINSYKEQFKRTPNSVVEPIIKKKLTLERDISDLQKTIEDVANISIRLQMMSKTWNDLLAKFKKVPKNYLSDQDQSRLTKFQTVFREMARKFGYTSTMVTDIEINDEKYTPFLSGEILKREIKSQQDIVPKTDIKGDSSASDFVRLIWAYLISLYQVSDSSEGNHPRFLAFDEPAQHSMAIESLRNLFVVLSGEKDLQSLVGASFDESDQVFSEATQGLKFNLIRLDEKLIKKI